MDNNNQNLVGRVEELGREASENMDVNEKAKAMEEANALVIHMFIHKCPIDDTLQILSRLPQSPAQWEQFMFHVIVEALFVEYQYFEGYPMKSLEIVATLWGRLIKDDFFKADEAYKLAGRAFVELALLQPAETKTFKFGAMALEHFVDRLPNWPTATSHILLSPGLQSDKPWLYAYIKLQQDLCSLGPPVVHLNEKQPLII